MTERRRPLTQDQLELISSETRHAASKVLRRYVEGSLIGFALLLFGIGAVFNVTQANNDSAQKAIVQSGRIVAVDGCNRDYGTITKLRAVLANGQAAVEAAHKRGTLGDARYTEAVEFYKTQRASLKLPDCRKAKDILTDSPDNLGPVPTPKHP